MKAHCEAGKLQEEKKKSVKVQQQRQRLKNNAINVQMRK